MIFPFLACSWHVFGHAVIDQGLQSIRVVPKILGNHPKSHRGPSADAYDPNRTESEPVAERLGYSAPPPSAATGLPDLVPKHVPTWGRPPGGPGPDMIRAHELEVASTVTQCVASTWGGIHVHMVYLYTIYIYRMGAGCTCRACRHRWTSWGPIFGPFFTKCEKVLKTGVPPWQITIFQLITRITHLHLVSGPLEPLPK